ncbi:MAG: ATP-binding protein [Bacteroidales bacterium]|nr:ATP-binding protein [Bacteroidales bacterium]
MLYRKISKDIESFLRSDNDKIMILEGARQTGKSFIIRQVGKKLFKNFVEINFVEDHGQQRIFADIQSTNEFYLALSTVAGGKLGKYDNTLVFLDEIQQYPQYLTMLKFLRQDRRYRFIVSGSLLGISLHNTLSVPVGSIIHKQMYQLDFEEFLLANDFSFEAIEALKVKYKNKESLSEPMHNKLMDLFKRYLLVGGLPDSVNTYLDTHNIVKVRQLQQSIYSLYAEDAAKYESNFNKNLVIKRIYEMIPSQMENKKKRLVAKDIKGDKGDRFSRYQDEFEYLISSGTVLSVNAVSNPHYPLTESVRKNLLKLYLNDVGLLTLLLYRNNIQPILNDENSINLGAVYESVVAQELKAHGFKLFYFDNRQKGEVDFIIDDYNNVSLLPIEVKSGKDYTVHSALNNLLKTADYNIKNAVVLSNKREVKTVNNITYMPVYYVMFIDSLPPSDDTVYF